MSEFESVMIQIGPQGAEPLSPTSFAGRMSETELEDALVAHPGCLGEELLVLGRQLIDFVEDNKRLDVLALDKGGEVVLIEAKVDVEYTFTDLQALGYAGAYADRTTTHFAKTLLRSVQKGKDQNIRIGSGLTTEAKIEEAQESIRKFLELTSFEEWRPSKQVKIKLVAPGFPKRVLHNVKWLGDVYGMPIEAIRAQMFVVGDDQQIYFDRLLPLPGSEDFDLSIRDREESISKSNGKKNKPVLSLLVHHGVVEPGDRIWLTESAFPPIYRQHFEQGNPLFSGTIDDSTPVRLIWTPEGEPISVAPASLVAEICARISGKDLQSFQGTPVAENYVDEKSGKTLRELAFDSGLWE